MILSAKVANSLACRKQSVIVKMFINLSLADFLCSVRDTFGPPTASRLKTELVQEVVLVGEGDIQTKSVWPEWRKKKKTFVKCDLTDPTCMSWYLSSSFSGNFQQRQAPSVWAGFCPPTHLPPPPYTHTHTHTLKMKYLPRAGFCWNTSEF